MKNTLFLTLAAIGLSGFTQCLADGLPVKQPNVLHIWRESVKAGRGAEHAKHESGFVAAFEKAKSTAYGLALVSETGPAEAWYLGPFESNAAMGENEKRIAKDAGLLAELDRLERIDSEYINGVTRIVANARTDLSNGQFPDLAKARFYQITVYRIHPGHEDMFEAAAKAYRAANQRAGSKAGWRTYQVAAGMPGSTFLVMTSLEDYAQFDQLGAEAIATWSAATPEEKATLTKVLKESVVEQETNRFRVDPVQSFVPKETRAADPAFWSAQ